MAISFGGKKATCLSNFMIAPGFKSPSSVPTKCNSTRALHVAGNSTYSWRAKHTTWRFFFLSELVKKGKTTIHRVPTQQILTHCATKNF
ncbi:unnamed protein product, partial [Laminaria digitata]